MYKAFCNEIDDAHDHVKFRKRLVDVLMDEQKGHCCYCLRNLKDCLKVTIEHIMPNHAVDKVELDQYRNRSTELDELPHSDDFKLQNPIVYPPHPHSIAYQNLVLSCNGNLLRENTAPDCCNLKRKHQFLPPFILFSDIEQTFIYKSDGLAEWTQDPEPPSSKFNVTRLLGLNNSVLKMIRRIWFFCSDYGIDPRREGRNALVNIILAYYRKDQMGEKEANMLLNFKKEKYWSLFLQYEVFAKIKHI